MYTIEIFDPSNKTWSQGRDGFCGDRVLGAAAYNSDVYIVDEDDDEEEDGAAFEVSYYKFDEDSLFEDYIYYSDRQSDSAGRIHTRNCCSMVVRKIYS